LIKINNQVLYIQNQKTRDVILDLKMRGNFPKFVVNYIALFILKKMTIMLFEFVKQIFKIILCSLLVAYAFKLADIIWKL
jgi:hypothetical protein